VRLASLAGLVRDPRAIAAISVISWVIEDAKKTRRRREAPAP